MVSFMAGNAGVVVVTSVVKSGGGLLSSVNVLVIYAIATFWTEGQRGVTARER